MNRWNHSVRRRGFALVLVMALVSLTLGTAYVVMRTQAYERMLVSNATRDLSARNAAQTGISVALRKMYDGTWPGADQEFSQNLNAAGTSGFRVSFTTGDSSLTAGAANYSEFPYRVTIVSTGFAVDPVSLNNRVEHAMRVVVRLMPRNLATNAISQSPSLESYSCYQTKNNDPQIQFPVRFTGDVYLQGNIRFSDNYPLDKYDPCYLRYFDDLWAYKVATNLDYRPFGGRLLLPVAGQTTDFTDILANRLHTDFVDTPRNNAPPLSPANCPSYQLYAKGKQYTPQALPLQSVVLAAWQFAVPAGTYSPDPITNPLGIFLLSERKVAIRTDTTIEGTILHQLSNNATVPEAYIAGNNINLRPTSLPSVVGQTYDARLPTFLNGGSLSLQDGTSRTCAGLCLAQQEFSVAPGVGESQITFKGTILSDNIKVRERYAWTWSKQWWSDRLDDFVAKRGVASNYFPEWMAKNYSNVGFFLAPKATFEPPVANTKYFYPSDWTQPVFVPLSSDGGTLWEVVSWNSDYTP